MGTRGRRKTTTKPSKRYENRVYAAFLLAPQLSASKTTINNNNKVHEKLKLGSKEVLNCYYAHAEDGMQRRCYWLLEGNDAIVLVHYLDTSHSKAARKQGWIQPRPIDPVTGQLPTAPPPAPAVNPMGARKVSLSFSAEPMVTSHSMTTMTASGSFTITTGHSMVPVAEFRMTSKDSVLSENNGGAVRDEPSAAEVLHGDDHGAPPSLPATQRITETMAVPLVGPGTLLPQSPFYTQQRDAGPRHAAPDSPSRVLHGFDPEVLGLNRGGALPGASGLRGDGPSSQQQHSTLTEAQASNLAVAYVARSLQQQGLMPSASFAQYQSQDGGDGGGRRGSQAAVSAFEL